MNEWLKKNLDILKDNLYKDYDCFIVVSGRERFGKSTLAEQIAYYLDPTYTINHCVFTPDQFHEAVENSKKYQAIVFDEAHGALNAKESMSSVNKKLTQTFTEMGFRNLIIILVLPSFFELGKYAAIHRSNALLNVHKRGEFLFFNYKKKKQLYLTGKRFYTIKTQANFIGNFTKHRCLDTEIYNEKKRNSTTVRANLLSKQEMRWIEQRNVMIEMLVNEYGLKQSELQGKIGLNHRTISEILRKNRQIEVSPNNILLSYHNDKGSLPITTEEEQCPIMTPVTSQ